MQSSPLRSFTGSLDERYREISKAVRAPELSVIIPIYNEAGNINALWERLQPALRRTGRSFEVIAVNDGSSDESGALLKAIAAAAPEFRVVEFRRNYGQTAAMMAGIEALQRRTEAHGDAGPPTMH